MTKKHLFSRLHKWGIANAPATEAERFAEACFVEKFGRRRQSRPKTSVISVAKNLCNLWLIFRAFCAFLWLKNQRNPRNPWLIKDLRVYKILYNCRETFTDVMSALQITLFMQNKANFRKSQMNVNKVLTKDYDKRTLGERGKKQSQTNPNKAKFKKAKMNVTSYITKGYENKPPIRAPKKQSQTSKRQKPMQTLLPQRIMKKTVLSGPDKTNPNKPNQSQYAIRDTIYELRTMIYELRTNTIKLADAPVAGQSPAGSSAVKYPDNYRGDFFNRGFYLYTATLLKAQETHLSLYQS